MKNNIFKLFICLFVMLFSVSSLVVSAKKIEFDESRDENPTGEGLLTIGTTECFIEIDDETGFAYVCLDRNGNVTVLGTCEVEIVNQVNPEGIIIGETVSGLTSYGKLVLTQNVRGVFVIDVQGNLADYFSVGDKLIVTE